MYFPYLRGRQNELLCLRELLEQEKLSAEIIPVIEPVRCNSTLFSTLSKFIEEDRKIILIKNPKVGRFKEERHDMNKKIEREADSTKKERLEEHLKNYKKIWRDSHVISAFLCDDEIIDQYRTDESIKDKVLINTGMTYYDKYDDDPKLSNAKYTFVPKDIDFWDCIDGPKIILEDGYEKKKRNIDYITEPDNFFSKNHLTYKQHGMSGFSDYSIVGREYEESGFAPLAVAIHIVYFGPKNEIKVHHFVSESNENISDPARKFEEAMKNLIKWEDFDKIPKTYGLECLINYYKQKKFPGLGIIKKCSLMHHMEMMGNFLEGK